MKTCCVKGCRSQSYANCEISFHVFPRDPQLRAKWMEVIGNVTSKNPVICSRHFKIDDYRLAGLGPHVPSFGIGNRLKEDAVPFKVSETPSVVSQDSDDSMISDISEISEEIEEDKEVLDMLVPARLPSPKKFSHFGVNCQLPNPKEQKLKLEIRGLNQKLRRRDLKVKRLKKVLRDIRAKINASSLLNNTQESNKTTTRNTNTSFKPQITIIHKVVGGEKQ